MAGSGQGGSNERPNILLYCTDQQRFDTIAALGNSEIRTPHLDRLAAEGAAFTHAYCQNPVCTPSRASFLTGMYPSANHVIRNGCETYPASLVDKLISRIMSDAGYDCGLIGKLHLAGAHNGPENRRDDGFDYFQYSHMPYRYWPEGDSYLEWVRLQGHDPVDAIDTYDSPGLRVVTPDNGWAGLKVPTPGSDNAPPELHQTRWCTDKAIEFISQPRERPWFLSVNAFDPHPPSDPPWDYYKRYPPETLSDPPFRESDLHRQERLAQVPFAVGPYPLDVIRARQLKAAYYAMIELIDCEIGRLLDWLESAGLRENTVIIFTSDHGEALGDHGLVMKGARFYEGLVRVPLLWSWPAGATAGLQSNALVELVDIVPTLLEISGLPVPAHVQGRSLLPILTGSAPPDHHKDFVRCEYFYHSADGRPAYATMYRDERWKLVCYHGAGLGELFDLQNDPHEFDDLWLEPGRDPIRNELISRSFEAWTLDMDPGEPQVWPW